MVASDLDGRNQRKKPVSEYRSIQAQRRCATWTECDANLLQPNCKSVDVVGALKACGAMPTFSHRYCVVVVSSWEANVPQKLCESPGVVDDLGQMVPILMVESCEHGGENIECEDEW